MAKGGNNVGEILVATEVITPEQYRQACDVWSSTGRRGDIGLIIVEHGFAPEKAVTKAQARAMGVNFVDL